VDQKGFPCGLKSAPRELRENTVFLGRRDKPHNERIALKREAFVAEIPGILDDIQHTLFNRALAYRRRKYDG